MSWSASQYIKFESERSRPVRDMLANIPTAEVKSAADLGCGPGNSTELLAARYPEAVIVGIDSSADMIEAARRRMPGVRFEQGDMARWANPGPFDVILANASLQWVPDHAALLPALAAKLAPGGSLAVQIPDNLDEPVHRLMREVAESGPWAGKLAGAGRTNANRHDAEWYYRTLRGSVGRVDIWRTTYFHELSGGAGALVEWFKGTGLRPFLDRLDPEEQADFIDRYRTALACAYEAFGNGNVLLPFPRLFFVATR
jgi:trans-aconitate 2-methyltransferase